MPPSVAKSLQGRVAAYTRWSKTVDRTAATAPARAGMRRRFEREVDPDGTLAPDVRARLAESARRAFYSRMALARHRKKQRS